MALFQKGHIPWHKGKGKKWGIPLFCKTCKKEFILDGEKGGHSGYVYCSKECKDKDNSWKIKVSKTKTGVPNLKARGKPHYYHRGERNPNWNGGFSKDRSHYNSLEYINWRRDVFIRDEFTCRECGVKHTYITAHHIKSWRNYPELRYEVDNGKTLCEDCHKKTDNYKGRARKEVLS